MNLEKKFGLKLMGGKKGETGYSVDQSNDGGYIITGQTYSYGSNSFDSDLWLLKTDQDGNLIWDRSFGGSNSESGYDVKKTADGGYIVVGETYSYGSGINDIWLLKIEEPVIHIELDGGLGLTEIITNNGDIELSNIKWSIEISKGFVFGGKDGKIDSISADSNTTLNTYLFGLGESRIRYTVDDISITKTCFILGPFVSFL